MRVARQPSPASPTHSTANAALAPAHTTTKSPASSNPTANQPSSPPDQDTRATSPDATGVIDMETFLQILDLDEDDTHDFSKGMAWAYFSQAAHTFTEMDEALAAKDLAKLSSLGHFLKGSSAALGVAKVQASCERMQHLGQRRDEEAGVDLSQDEALSRIAPLLVAVKKEYAVAQTWLKNWYKENVKSGPEGHDEEDEDE